MMTDTARNLNLRLPDGRNLSFSDIGTGENGTWIHCHGIPGSRHELLHLQSTLLNAGVRVIVPDRPGYGQSTPFPEYGFSNHSDDLRQLAGHLQLDQFRLSGFSGGGVFAMAAAHELGNRIEELVIAATPAVPLMENPYDYASELTASTWRRALDDSAALASELEALTISADVLSEALLGAAGIQDRRFLLSGSVHPGFMKSVNTALAQGSKRSAEALARDSFMICRSWTFTPAELEMPARVIHGSDDELVYIKHFLELAKMLPRSTAEAINGGHYSSMNAIWTIQ